MSNWDTMSEEDENKLIAKYREKEKALVDYIVLEERSIQELTTQVKTYLQSGYRLAGGVSSVAAHFIEGGERVFVQTYLQAITR